MSAFIRDAGRSVCLVLVLFLFAALSETASGDSQKPREYWPTTEWKTSTPELQGLDPARLRVADAFVRERLPDAFSLLVVKNGYLVFEKYYSFGSSYKIAVVHSVTKSVTSALIGIALEKGHLQSVDQKLIEFFPEYVSEDSDPRRKQITIRHLLTMSAGFRWDDRGPSMANWYTGLDWIEGAIQLPQDHSPGEVFTYNSSNSHILSAILTKATQTSTLDFARANLFEPLGIASAYWRKDPQGYFIGGFGLGLSARDLAKIGFLYLNNGYWDGRSVVPEEWVQASTRLQISAFGHPLYGRFGYGYQWWVKEVDGCRSFRAWGRRGQYIVVVPELDLVIAVTSNPQMPHPPTSIHYSPLFDLVATAVKRERPVKVPLKPVGLPEDAAAFVDRFNRAIADMDSAKIADTISDRFLAFGATKRMFLGVFLDTMSYVRTIKLVLTGFDVEGNIARIEGAITDKYFERPISPGMLLIKENGQWKWYGNQLQKIPAIEKIS